MAVFAFGALATPTKADGVLEFLDSDAVRLQKIEKSPNENTWPFTVAEGYLTCQKGLGQRAVFFVSVNEGEEPGGDDINGMVILSRDPFELTVGNIASRHLLRQMDSVEDLLKAVIPYYQLGKRLCDQPAGARLGPGEL
jgi:hypothetical protein